MTKTTSFVRHLINIPYSILIKYGFKDAYLGNYNETQDEWGKNIYFVFDISKVSLEARKEFMNFSEFISVELDADNLIFKFEIKEDDYYTVVMPFLHGQYSKICRQYVVKNFVRTIPETKKVSNNWKVLTKSPDLRKYWEGRIGVEFTEDMEVWSRPEKEDEIYGYPKSDSELAPEAGSVSNTGC